MSSTGADVEIDISGEIDTTTQLIPPTKKGLLMQLPMQLQLASPAAREWITRRRENVRPWLVFLNTQKFKVPPTAPRWSKRLIKNVDYFQSNYMFVFIILILYCLITSPMLLLAVAASLGACYILSVKNGDKKIIIAGHEVPLAHQYTAIGILSFPVFYLAGAGAALFWVLGASFVIIALHASLYNIESIVGLDEEPFELEMEQV